MSREIAQLEFDGKLKTSVEEPGQVHAGVDFGGWQADGGLWLSSGRRQTRARNKGCARSRVIAQLGPDEFVVTGIDASVNFHLPGKLPWSHSQILQLRSKVRMRMECGNRLRLWNGDETDRGLLFYQKPEVVRVKLGRF